MTKARQKTIAPEWSNLPDHVQNDFHNAGFGNWYQQANNEGRLTLMNNYLKMSEADLWKFVQGPADPDPNRAQAGRLEFVTRNVQELRDHLYRREDFANPEPTPIISRFRNERWDSREHTHENSLHLKNFEGWPENRIQAHIDQQGLVPPPDAWREREPDAPHPLLQQLGQHLASDHQDVHDISERLKSKGFGLNLPW